MTWTWLRRLLLACLTLLAIPWTARANQNAQGWCETGNRPTVTSGLTSTTKVQQSFPACTVTVTIVGGGLATIFSDNSGTPLANPFTAASNGRWIFYAANGRYNIQLSGSGFPSPVTYTDISLSDPANQAAALPCTTLAFSATPSFAVTNNVCYQMALTGNIISSVVTGTPANGNLLAFTFTQDAIGGRLVVLPGNFIIPAVFSFDTAPLHPNYLTFKFDGTNWSFLTNSGTGGGGGGSSLLALNNTWTGTNLFNLGVSLGGATSGSTQLLATAVAGSTVATFPANTGTVAELNFTQTWTAPQTFSSTALANALISTSASPAATGFLRLATGDSGCWRNFAGSTDLCLTKTSSDVLTWASAFGASPFVTLSASPAQSGQIRLSSGEGIGWRVTANSGDVLLTKNASDNLVWPNSISVGGTLLSGSASGTATLPANTGTVAELNFAQTWTAPQSFSNGTELRFFGPNGVNYVGLKGPGTNPGVNYTLALPAADSTGVQCLSSNGSGVTSFSTCSAGTGTPGGALKNLQYQGAGSTFAGASNINYTAATGVMDFAQLANSNQTITGSRFTDTAPTGNLIRFQNAALNANLFQVDVLGALTAASTITGSTFISSSANTSATGTVRLSNTDIFSWRNATNGGDIPVVPLAASGTLPANTIYFAQGLSAAFITDGQSATASAGFLRMVSGAAINFRNNLNGADVNGVSKNSSDVVVLGGTAGINAASLTLTAPLAIAQGGSGQITAAAAFNALSPVTSTGDLIIGTGANTAGRLAIGGNGLCLVSNGTTANWNSCAAGTVSGSAVTGQGTFWTASSGLGGSANWTYAAASGHSVTQGANNVDALYIKRFTDTTPTGNFLHFQNAAAGADIAKLDVSGNLTVAGFLGSSNTSFAGMAQFGQGSANALVANAIQLAAPASVAASGEQFVFPGNPSNGFIRWTNVGGVLTGSLVPASGIGTCSGTQLVSQTNDNAAPTCANVLASMFTSQGANQVLVSPSGSSGVPTFRTLVGADIPAISLNSAGNGGVANILGFANGGCNAATAAACFNNISPMTTAGDIIYGGTAGAGTRLAVGTATQLLHSGTTPSWSAVSLTADVTGVLPLANGGTNASSGLANTNGAVYSDGTKLVSTATGGAGTLCLVSVNGATPAFASCAGSASTVWSSLSNPVADLSLTMGTNNSLFTSGVITGTRNAWEFTDGNSTSTGIFLYAHTGTTSTMPPVKFTARGTADGVDMTIGGLLEPIGNGGIKATTTNLTLNTTSPITGGGALTGNMTFACATCVTSGASLPNNAVAVASGGGQGIATKSFADLTANDYVAGGGTAQAQTATLAPAASALTAGLVVAWLPTAANSGAAPTLAVNGLTAKNITKLGTAALVANDLTTTAVAVAIYDGTQFQLQNPQTSSGGGGTTLQVGGVSVNATANLNSTTPALPTSVQGSSAAPAVMVGGAIPITFQKDANATTGIAAYVANLVSLPNYRVTRLCLANGSGTAANPIFCDLGDKIQVINTITTLTNVASTSTVPPLAKIITGTATTIIGYQSATAVGFFTGTNLLYQAGVKLEDWNATAGTWNERVVFGLASTGIITGASDTPTGYGGYFRASSNVPDTNFQCMVANNAAATATDSGVAVDNNFHRFQIFFNDSTAHVLFYIDNVQKCDVSSGVPATGNSMRRFVSVQPISAASKAIDVAWDMVQGDQ